MSLRTRKLRSLLILVCVVSVGFIVIKEMVDPSAVVDLKIDDVRYEYLPVLSTVLESFVRKHGRPPTEDEGLSAIVCSQPDARNCIVYLAKDPWSHPYVYRHIAAAPGYMVYSIGVNGIDEHGGGDDITTWPKEYTCREYGVGCVHIAGLLEFIALVLVVGCACVLVYCLVT